MSRDRCCCQEAAGCTQNCSASAETVGRAVAAAETEAREPAPIRRNLVRGVAAVGLIVRVAQRTVQAEAISERQIAHDRHIKFAEHFADAVRTDRRGARGQTEQGCHDRIGIG